MKKISAVIFLFLFTVFPSHAGTFIKAIDQSYKDSKFYTWVLISIDQGKMKIELQGPAVNGFLFYNQATSTLDFADAKTKKCFEITPVEQAQIQAFAKIMIAQGEKDKKSKNGQQIANSKAMINSAVMKPGVPQVKGVKFDGFICDQYVSVSKKKKTFDFWETQSAETLMAPVDLNTYQSLVGMFIDFIGGIVPEVSPQQIAQVKQYSCFQQLPVGLLSYQKGKKLNLFRVLSVQPQTFPIGALDVPVDYVKSNPVQTLLAALTAAAAKGAK